MSIDTLKRLRVTLRGAVQGVGFRPFVFRLAQALELPGFVCNTVDGVTVEVEGHESVLDEFRQRLTTETPILATVRKVDSVFLDPTGFSKFEILDSREFGSTRLSILPDIATCSDCIGEIFDPTNRRYQYPFANCTNCGPRFTIIRDLPYDRCHTSMNTFQMCDDCQVEYKNPNDRRFHAQPIACPKCGPQIEAWDGNRRVIAAANDAVALAVSLIRNGGIVAVKGLGGYHLMAYALSDDAVSLLRKRKQRQGKPFAVMFPDLRVVKKYCDVSPREAELLSSPESPIVLLAKCAGESSRNRPTESALPELIAPGNRMIGALLPYTPLHHLIMDSLGSPVIATSGNLADETICIANDEAVDRLGGIADLFLVHNRPILRHADDSIARIIFDTPQLLRRARGFTPSPIYRTELIPGTLGVGAHLKSTVAMTTREELVLSQHIGDLGSVVANQAYESVSNDLQRLLGIDVDHVCCDMHPDYASTQSARLRGVSITAVQHHYAHALSCMVDNELDCKRSISRTLDCKQSISRTLQVKSSIASAGSFENSMMLGISSDILAVCWDGSGYGTDGTIWGGEFLRVDNRSYTRAAHIRPFMLPGGERAISEPRRAAIGLLHEYFGTAISEMPNLIPIKTLSQNERITLFKMLENKINSPVTTSMGRVFDAVASLIGLRQVCDFEGQAAIELESIAESGKVVEGYEIGICGADNGGDNAIVVDLGLMLEAILKDIEECVPTPEISARFHQTLATITVYVAQRIGLNKIVLTGGCFQNRLLTELTVSLLRDHGFTPYWHRKIPPNDGGIAVGQVAAGMRQSQQK